MGRILSFAPYAKAGFAEWVHFLLLDSPCLSPFPCGDIDSQAGLGFQWLRQSWRQSSTCSHGHLFIQSVEN